MIGLQRQRAAKTLFRNLQVAALLRGLAFAIKRGCGRRIGFADHDLDPAVVRFLFHDASAMRAATASRTRAMMSPHSPTCRWRNSRIDGYHGLSSRSSCQYQ